jgi:hypothetical protein
VIRTLTAVESTTSPARNPGELVGLAADRRLRSGPLNN